MNQDEYNGRLERSPYHYCTRCGGELTNDERVAYTHDDAPEIPYCAACWNEILTEVRQLMSGPVADLYRSVIESFQPLLEWCDEFVSGVVPNEESDHD